MRRLLTGYAVRFNRRHRRHGQLFQNRYKSIACQEEVYLKELVRYIHLNPLRTKLVLDTGELNQYRYSGHIALAGKRQREWQETGHVLSYFGERVRELGLSGTFLARRYGMSQPGVVYAVRRGERIAERKGYRLI